MSDASSGTHESSQHRTNTGANKEKPNDQRFNANVLAGSLILLVRTTEASQLEGSCTSFSSYERPFNRPLFDRRRQQCLLPVAASSLEIGRCSNLSVTVPFAK